MASNTQSVYTPDPYVSLRNQMVKKQLEGRQISDTRVLEAMRKIPRHLFVPDLSPKSAYDDGPLPIACGQTISQPYIVAKIAELLELEGGERVMEVGAGCGYQLAILACLAKQVVGVEYYEELGDRAREVLEKIGISNATVVAGDGKGGWIEGAPYDAIVVSCAAREVLPAWEEQLKPGGKLVFPHEQTGAGRSFGSRQMLRRFTLGKKGKKEGWAKREDIFGVRFVPLL